jgi:ABC-type nitrate/sulfonate/bicarbonate transport system permease component
MIKRASMMITIIGLILIWFGVNQENDMLLLIALALLFTGFSGLYWGFRNMRGAGIFRRL